MESRVLMIDCLLFSSKSRIVIEGVIIAGKGLQKLGLESNINHLRFRHTLFHALQQYENKGRMFHNVTNSTFGFTFNFISLDEFYKCFWGANVTNFVIS